MFPGFFIVFYELICDFLIDNNIRNESQYNEYNRSSQKGIVVYVSCKGTSQQDDYSDQDQYQS